MVISGSAKGDFTHHFVGTPVIAGHHAASAWFGRFSWTRQSNAFSWMSWVASRNSALPVAIDKVFGVRLPPMSFARPLGLGRVKVLEAASRMIGSFRRFNLKLAKGTLLWHVPVLEGG
jgi:hypothetical protein